MNANLLVELLTEELPPKDLRQLGDAFGHRVQDFLIRAQLKTRESQGTKFFAAPRRLAVFIPDVQLKASDRTESKKLMPAKVAFDLDGNPSDALTKRLEKENASVNQLERRIDGKTEFVFLSQTILGVTLATGLRIALEEAITKLPTPKVMSYQLADGATTVQFVRPAKGLLALYGDDVVEVSILGLQAGRTTFGHRFLTSGPITIKSADDYERALREEGRVEAHFADRRARIKEELKRAEEKLPRAMTIKGNGRIPINVERIVVDTEDTHPGHLFARTTDYFAVERALDCSGGTELLDEVAALVEWPRAYWGRFENRFLDLPVECLALTMKHNQKYFPVFDASANLLPYFVVIGNNDDSLAEEHAAKVVENIVSGNERVLRPRLADARFFYDQDRKTRLEDRVPSLARVIYHNKLGSQLDRVDRIELLAGKIARDLGGDSESAERAAELCKADLLTNMVGEFPELQGIVGRYYALYNGESQLVADAIEQHYWPRFAGDRLPKGNVSCSVALADKLDSLVGFFYIDQIPSGDKDPFGLRRQALAVVRILMETPLAASLTVLLTSALAPFQKAGGFDRIVESVHTFIIERLRHYEGIQKAFEPEVIEAIVSQKPDRLDTVIYRLIAVNKFRELPEARQLAAANKRIVNILSKANYPNYSPLPDIFLAKEDAEFALLERLQKLGQYIDGLLLNVQSENSYVDALISLATLRDPIDRFFKEVMVMVDDKKIRENRLAILQRLASLMNRVADISVLDTSLAGNIEISSVTTGTLK